MQRRLGNAVQLCTGEGEERGCPVLPSGHTWYTSPSRTATRNPVQPHHLFVKAALAVITQITPRCLCLDLELRRSSSHFPLVPLRNRT